MIIKKSFIGIIVLTFASLILTTGYPFQITNNLFENNELLYIKYFGQPGYAAHVDNKEADEQHDDDDDDDD